MSHCCSCAYTAAYPPPLLYCPKLPSETVIYIAPAKVTLYEFVTISDGTQKVFSNEDELMDYRKQGIVCPQTVSYTNLFSFLAI